MNFAQRLFSRLFGPNVEKESHEWMVECQKCSRRISVWELGGIRFKASGTKWRYAKCGKCGVRTQQVISRHQQSPKSEI
jgi:DNA-directed RNA polymerase subunit RPC12/RpoP